MTQWPHALPSCLRQLVHEIMRARRREARIICDCLNIVIVCEDPCTDEIAPMHRILGSQLMVNGVGIGQPGLIERCEEIRIVVVCIRHEKSYLSNLGLLPLAGSLAKRPSANWSQPAIQSLVTLVPPHRIPPVSQWCAYRHHRHRYGQARRSCPRGSFRNPPTRCYGQPPRS